MFKYIILFNLLLATLFAQQENFPFLGVSISTQTVDIKPNNTLNSSSKNTTLSLRYGQQTLDWRTLFALEYHQKFQTFSLEIDKILLDNMFGRPEVRPYLGGTFGYMKYKDISIAHGHTPYYGVNVGFLLYATDRIDADISYHYYNILNLKPLKNMQGGTLGFNYFY
jgi:hypothetical protein